MRPPICAICDERFFSGGGLVQFVLTPEQEVELKRMEDKKIVGHPPGLDWFCEKHIESAKNLSHLNIQEAMKILREEFKK